MPPRRHPPPPAALCAASPANPMPHAAAQVAQANERSTPRVNLVALLRPWRCLGDDSWHWWPVCGPHAPLPTPHHGGAGGQALLPAVGPGGQRGAHGAPNIGSLAAFGYICSKCEASQWRDGPSVRPYQAPTKPKQLYEGHLLACSWSTVNAIFPKRARPRAAMRSTATARYCAFLLSPSCSLAPLSGVPR